MWVGFTLETTNITPLLFHVLPGSKGMVISQHLEGQNVPPSSTKASHFLTCLQAVLALLPLARSGPWSRCCSLLPDPRPQTPGPVSLREQFPVSRLQTDHSIPFPLCSLSSPCPGTSQLQAPAAHISTFLPIQPQFSSPLIPGSAASQRR